MKMCPQCQRIAPDTHTFCPLDGAILRDTNAPGVDRWLGRTLEHRYRILQVLGRGGMGVVYLGEHLRIGRQVAIKLVNQGGTGDIQRLEREARAVTLIGHDNIVNILDFGRTADGDAAFMVMEYLRGETLRDRLQRQGPMSLTLACHVMTQAAHALEAAHARGVVHRDIKPANIFICEEGERKDVVKLLDFGIAGLRSSRRGAETSPATSVMGTAGYLAPEQVRGDLADFRSDVFSLGVTFYETLSGVAPFGDRGEPAMLLARTLREMHQPLSERIPQLPLAKDVDELVELALRKDPDVRLSSMRAFRAMLVELRRKLNQPTRRRVEQFERRAELDRHPVKGWVTNNDGRTIVELSGVLDERADLGDITERIVGPNVEVRLSRVRRINSAGHLVWTRWLRSLLAAKLELSFTECSPELIRQGNMNSVFFQGRPIVSFFAPFYCEQCDLNRDFLFRSADVIERGIGKRLCELCGNEMVFDDVEQTYFLFLRHRPRRRERRRATRANRVAPVRCTLADGSTRQLYLSNVSMGGVFVIAMRAVPVGTQVQLDISDGNRNLPSLFGDVVHTLEEPFEPERNGFGVAFGSLDAVQRDALRAFVAASEAPERNAEIIAEPERRRQPRISIEVPLTLSWEGKTAQGRLLNLSMAGGLIVADADASLKPQQNVQLEIRGVNSAREIKLGAQLVRQAESEVGKAFGAHFIEVDSQSEAWLEQMMLRRIVERHN